MLKLHESVAGIFRGYKMETLARNRLIPEQLQDTTLKYPKDLKYFK